MTMVTITITLPVEGDDTDTPEVRAALDALADVMLVQAEDGLYTLGSPDACDWRRDEQGTAYPVESQYLRGIGSGATVAVTIHPPEVTGQDLTTTPINPEEAHNG